MLRELAEVWQYRELLTNLVIRDIKVRYKNSVLGFFWSLLLPLSQAATLTVVFKYVMHVTLKDYSAYLLSAIIPFNFFAQSVLESANSVLNHVGLVKKTYFPREILPMAVVISNLIHFILAMVVFVFYLVILRTPIMTTWLLLPAVMLITFVLTMGFSLLLAGLNTFYEDVKYITTVVINLIFYALPILYVIELPLEQQISSRKLTLLLHAYFYLNPLSYLTTAIRKMVLPPFNGVMWGQQLHDIPLSYRYLGISALISFIIFIIGYSYFNSRKWYFAERI